MSLEHYLMLGIALFGIGLLGVLTQKNLIKFLMCVEIMINGVNLNFAAYASFINDFSGQTFVMFILAISAAEVAVGLAIAILIYRTYGNIDISTLMGYEDADDSNKIKK